MSQRGLPLLSGPPPHMESGDACRKCNKEFNVFLNRSRKCNHCGYLYCSNCSDYQALMPRSGQESGYDGMPVCAFCIDFLSITAAGKGMLKTMQLSKLKKYLEAYNIDIGRVFEKDDLIEAILKARRSNGCLPPENEDYYRNYSVPDRSTSHTRSRFFGRSASNRTPASPPPPPPSNTRPYNFPRPDLEPDLPPRQPYAPRSGPPPPPRQTHPSYQSPPPVPPRPQYQPSPQQRHHQQQHHQQSHNHHHRQHSHYPPPHPPPPPQASRPTAYPQYQRPSAARSTENLQRSSSQQSRQRTTSAAPPAAPPLPTLDQLLDMSDDSIKMLSISVLKSILFTNHVNARQILEKGDLIVKVKALIEDERRDRERQRVLQEAEEQEALERQRVLMEEHRKAQAEREERTRTEQQAQGQERSGSVTREGQGAGAGTGQNAETEGSPQPSTSSPAPAPPLKLPPKTRGTAADLERTGLCVICQDDEANIAIVDCGHLAMCRGCSDLIMASSRECPLCRTRIVTESRLLRIFKT